MLFLKLRLGIITHSFSTFHLFIHIKLLFLLRKLLIYAHVFGAYNVLRIVLDTFIEKANRTPKFLAILSEQNV